MRVFLFFFAALSLNCFSDEPIKEIHFIKTGDIQRISIEIKNPTNNPIHDLKVKADCGCIILEDWTHDISPGESGCVKLVVQSASERRKLNKILCFNGQGFKREYDLVMYFCSSSPQVFGDTVIQLSASKASLIKATVVVIGNGTLSGTRVLVNGTEGIVANLGDPQEIAGSPDCYKRVLSLSIDRDRLLSLGHKVVNVVSSLTGNIDVDIN